jgi:hypothetical protein
MAERRSRRLIWQLTIALAVAVILIAALILAVVAVVRSSTVGVCVNDTLGDRNGLTKLASVNQIRNEQAQQAALKALLSPDAQTRLRAYRAYQVEHDHYVRVLVQIQKSRDKKPLGHC